MSSALGRTTNQWIIFRTNSSQPCALETNGARERIASSADIGLITVGIGHGLLELDGSAKGVNGAGKLDQRAVGSLTSRPLWRASVGSNRCLRCSRRRELLEASRTTHGFSANRRNATVSAVPSVHPGNVGLEQQARGQDVGNFRFCSSRWRLCRCCDRIAPLRRSLLPGSPDRGRRTATRSIVHAHGMRGDATQSGAAHQSATSLRPTPGTTLHAFSAANVALRSTCRFRLGPTSSASESARSMMRAGFGLKPTYSSRVRSRGTTWILPCRPLRPIQLGRRIERTNCRLR